jgi:hypothetical protein
MNARTVIEVLKRKISEARDAGIGETGFALASLENLVSQIERDVTNNPALEVTSVAVEQAKLNQAVDLASYAAKVQFKLELSKSVISTAKVAVNSLILVNGGSPVALLAFVGHLATSGRATAGVAIAQLAWPLTCFGLGVGCAALTAAFVTLGQKAFVGEWSRTGNVFVALAILTGAVAIACYFTGLVMAYPVFLKL